MFYPQGAKTFRWAKVTPSKTVKVTVFYPFFKGSIFLSHRVLPVPSRNRHLSAWRDQSPGPPPGFSSPAGLFLTLVLADLTMALDGPGCPRLALDGFSWTWLALALSWSGLDPAGRVWESPLSRQCMHVCAYLKNGSAACVTRIK